MKEKKQREMIAHHLEKEIIFFVQQVPSSEHLDTFLCYLASSGGAEFPLYRHADRADKCALSSFSYEQYWRLLEYVIFIHSKFPHFNEPEGFECTTMARPYVAAKLNKICRTLDSIKGAMKISKQLVMMEADLGTIDLGVHRELLVPLLRERKMASFVRECHDVDRGWLVPDLLCSKAFNRLQRGISKQRTSILIH